MECFAEQSLLFCSTLDRDLNVLSLSEFTDKRFNIYSIVLFNPRMESEFVDGKLAYAGEGYLMLPMLDPPSRAELEQFTSAFYCELKRGDSALNALKETR